MGWTFLKRMMGREGGGVAAGDAQVAEWPSRLKEMDVFRDLPDDSIAEMCARMEPVPVKKGEVIIREGEEGDYYYAIVEGSAQVTRKAQSAPEESAGDAAQDDTLLMAAKGKRQKAAKPKPQPQSRICDLAILKKGMGFGEEALLSNAKRNATVTMQENGMLMRVSKSDFDELLKAPKLRWLSAVEAKREIAGGAKWLDVRTEREHQWGSLGDSLCIPLQDIRDRSAMLSRDTLYICYCETGRLSATAAFLLVQMGFRAAVLRGGLRRQ